MENLASQIFEFIMIILTFIVINLSVYKYYEYLKLKKITDSKNVHKHSKRKHRSNRKKFGYLRNIDVKTI
ncbi:MAG: hypothetical protein H8E57_10970 [Candidatus Cloacimonetes bacterium]|nr:hypothetical protein [Candidatus Cloacimonadota bacterium]